MSKVRSVVALGLLLGGGFLLGCSSQPTGLLINVDLAGFDVDELQYGVSISDDVDQGDDGRVLVDPSGKGRVHGRHHGNEHAQQPIFVNDDAAGKRVICEVTGLSGGMVVATGNGADMLKPHALTEVTVILHQAPDLPGRGDTPIDASGGTDVAGDAGDHAPPGPEAGGAGGTSGDGGGGLDAPVDRSSSGGSGGGGGRDAGGSGGRPGGGSGGMSGGTGGRVGGTGGTPGGGSGGAPGTMKPKGTACRAGTECATGFCVDGVCCTAPCIGGCRVCNDARSRGDCRLADRRAPDPRGRCANAPPCGTDGTCDGNGACAPTAAGVTCGPPMCKNKNFVIPARTCDGAGQCQSAPDMQKCDGKLSCVDGVCR